MKMHNIFSKSDLVAIESAVKAAERETSGEVVPVVVEKSSRYSWLVYRAALLGLLAGSFASVAVHIYHPFVFEMWMIFSLQTLGMLAGWVCTRTQFGIRLLLDQKTMAEEVREAAQAAFLRHGLMNTRDRTGVLVFLSLLERRVVILGDQGIHEKVGEAFWQSEVNKVAQGMRGRECAKGLIAVIDDIGQALKKHFPARADDANELGNKLRFD